MKKGITLWFLFLTLSLGLGAQICNPFPPDPQVTNLGFNPNPIPEAVSGTNYNHQNTVVLPGKVDNTLTLPPGDSIDLCGIKIESVTLDTMASYNQNIPANFNFSWEVWQDLTSPAITAANSSSTPISMPPGTSLKRVCLRFTSTNVPQPINNPCDTVYFKVDVRGRIDLGFGCNDVPGNDGLLSFYIEMPICATASLENFGKGNAFQVLPMQPNPAKDQTELPVYLPTGGEVTLLLVDALGREVMRAVDFLGAGIHRLPVQTEHLSNGIYYFQIEAAGQGAGGKLLIQH